MVVDAGRYRGLAHRLLNPAIASGKWHDRAHANYRLQDRLRSRAASAQGENAVPEPVALPRPATPRSDQRQTAAKALRVR
jgi:hypothetical protein